MKAAQKIIRAPRARRSLLLTMMAALALLLALGGTRILPTQAQGAPSLTIQITSEARNGDPATNYPVRDDGKDQFVVYITLEGGTCPAVTRDTPVDVVLVIDTSGSMGNNTPENISKLEATKRAALTFISHFNLVPGSSQSDQIAIVTFSSNATLESDLSRDSAALQSIISGLSESGGTDIADGIEMATDILAGPQANYAAGAKPVIVVLSDGKDTDANAVRTEATRARQLVNAQIVTVGLGDSNDVDQDTLRDIADTPDLAFFTASAAQLNDFYDRIAVLVQPKVAASDLSITYTVNSQYFQIVPDTSDPKAAISGPGSAPDTLQWSHTGLNTGERITLRTEMRGLFPAAGAAVGTVTVNYFACEQPTVTTQTEIGPIVTILQPTATPSPTNTPTPTLTPTPTNTPTPTPNAVLRDPGVSEPVGGSTSMGMDFCAPGWWDWLPWVVVLIVLLVGLYLLWRALQNLLAKKKKTVFDWACWLLRLLALIMLLILLFLLLQPVAGALCDVPESVYFWRMDGSQRGIFLTHDKLEADQPAEVTSLNETTSCLGCHFVTNDGQMVGAIVGPVPDSDALRITQFDGDLLTDIPPIDAIYGAFSPDGQRIAVTTGNSELFVYDLDAPALGWQQIRGASDGVNGAMMPAWTPDGQNIAFVRANRANIEVGLLAMSRCDIALISADPGANAVPVNIVGASDNDGLNYYPAFSPDGRWLAFTSHHNTTTYSDPEAEIWLLDLATGDANPIAGNPPNASNSWATWNRDGTMLAFNTTAYDPNFDIVVVDVNPDGTTSAPRKLRGASQPGVFEHLPYWGEPIDRVNLLDEWRSRLWPLWCLLPLLVAMLIACWLRKPDEDEGLPELPPVQPPREPLLADDLPGGQLMPLWKPRGALVIGLGNAGWHVLTQLKKTLANAELDDPSENVRLLCVLDGSQARHLDRDAGSLMLDEDEVLTWQENLLSLSDTVNTDPVYKGWLDRQSMLAVSDATDPKTGFQDRRVMGRMALINNLRETSGVNLWDRLKAAAMSVSRAEAKLQEEDKDDLHDPERLYVILVTDLSDDVGSGAFLDVAYMVRKLQEQLDLSDDHDQAAGPRRLKEVRLVAHLLTDRATQGRQRGDLSRPTNTIATMRETSRFQLAVGAPFPMSYTRNPDEHSPLDGVWERSLFDEVYLYDGERRPATLSHVPPEVGVYPALADGVAMWLDTAANRGGLDRWRNSMRGNVRTTQLQERKMIVGSLGLYQFRLPFADLLEDLTVRFARRVLQILLMGDSMETPRYDPALAKEQFIPGTQNVTELVRAFLGERFGTPQFSAEWRVLFNGVVTNDADKVQKALRTLSVKPSIDDAAWKTWLLQVVPVLLNGQQSQVGDQIDPVLRRGAKISLAQSFLGTLDADSGLMSLKGIASQIERLTLDPAHPVIERLHAFAAIAGELRQQLIAMGDALGMGAKPDSLYTELSKRSDRIKLQWDQQRELQTRRYITETVDGEPLREVWYDTYMLKPDAKDKLSAIEKGVRQLYWKVDGQQRLVLVLSLPQVEGEEQVEFDPGDVAAFEEKLLHLGRYFAREIPDKEGLAKILNQAQLGEEQLDDTVRRLMQNSGVMLGTDEQARQMQPGIVLSAHEGIARAQELARELRKQLANPDWLLSLKTTDPFSLTLVQTADALTIDSVTSLQLAHETYMEEMGLNRPVSTAGRIAVFEAEATALHYERQLVKIKQPPRLLNPVVVTGLANRIKAETYLLAVILNEIHDTPAGWVFDAPEMGEDRVLIPRDELGYVPNGRLMDGLLRFVSSRSIGDKQWQPRISEATAQAIRNRFLRDDAMLETLDTWEVGQGADWRTRYTEADKFNAQVVEDLISLARLLIVNVLS